MALRPRNIELHIEELVLQGLAHADRHAIAEALQCELERLLATPEAFPQSSENRTIECLDGGGGTATKSMRPASVGTRVAQSIMTQINIAHKSGGSK